MAKDVRDYAATLAFGVALAILPMGVAVIGTPAPAQAECPAGQTPAGDGCRPHCPDGTLLDTETSKCLDLMSAAGSQLGFSVPTPADIPPLVTAPVEVGLPGVGLPGVGVGVNLLPPLFGAPALPGVGVPAVGVPAVGLPAVGLPERPALCGPGIDTPVPMVGWAPCI